MLQIRASVRADILPLCGETYAESMRGYTVIDGDDLVGIVGVLHKKPMQLFSVITDRLRESPKTIVKAAKLARDLFEHYDAVFALADPDQPAADRFLVYLGFTHYETNRHGRVYRWQQRYPG